MASKQYDAIVIGSGISGGWAVKELTENGMETLCLEAGRPIDPDKDYAEHVPIWEKTFRDLGDRKKVERDQPMQQKGGVLGELNAKFFVNDNENPYTTPKDKPFLWIRGRQVGGRSIMWGRQSYRWSDLDFEANLKESLGADWPIRYADLAPWYDHVEEFIGVSGRMEGLPQLPDGKFLPPMDFFCVEEDMRDTVAKYFGDERMLTIGRSAVLTQRHRGRAACHYCGPCDHGCSTKSYFSSLNSTLPAARATGKLTLRPHSVVHSLIYDSAKRRIKGVRVIDGQTKEVMEFNARIVFLCASSLESTRILLNSSTPEFTHGLCNSSGVLGTYVMDHCMGGGARGRMPGHENQTHQGRRPNGIYMPRFRNVKSKHKAFLRGYGYQGGGGRENWQRGEQMAGFGPEYKAELSQPGPWTFDFYGFGESLPSPKNRVEIDPEVKDAWGIPALRITCEYGENERAMLHDMSICAAEMLSAAGARDIQPFIEDNVPGITIHEMGGARMGRDPKTSVLNSHNQAHDAKNLFVTDGACMASTACVNPSLTYMALTARAVNYAVEAMKKNEL